MYKTTVENCKGSRKRGWSEVGTGPQPQGQRDGGLGCKPVLSGILVAWRTSLRSPCVTADSQRNCIIRTLQLQIKKENKIK